MLLTLRALDHVDVVRNATHTDVVAHRGTSVAADYILDKSIESWAEKIREGKSIRLGSWVVTLPLSGTNQVAWIKVRA